MRKDADIRFRRHVHRHAYQQMWVDRHTWSEEDRERTINTLYYAELSIWQHYATCKAVNPGVFCLVSRGAVSGACACCSEEPFVLA